MFFLIDYVLLGYQANRESCSTATTTTTTSIWSRLAGKDCSEWRRDCIQREGISGYPHADEGHPGPHVGAGQDC